MRSSPSTRYESSGKRNLAPKIGAFSVEALHPDPCVARATGFLFRVHGRSSDSRSSFGFLAFWGSLGIFTGGQQILFIGPSSTQLLRSSGTGYHCSDTSSFGLFVASIEHLKLFALLKGWRDGLKNCAGYYSTSISDVILTDVLVPVQVGVVCDAPPVMSSTTLLCSLKKGSSAPH